MSKHLTRDLEYQGHRLDLGGFASFSIPNGPTELRFSFAPMTSSASYVMASLGHPQTQLCGYFSYNASSKRHSHKWTA